MPAIAKNELFKMLKKFEKALEQQLKGSGEKQETVSASASDSLLAALRGSETTLRFQYSDIRFQVVQ